MSALTLRTAQVADAGLLLAMIRELADYERLPAEVQATQALMADALDAEPPIVHAVIAEYEGVPAGFALYFFNFSTFLGRPGLWLEDLFVRPSQRGHGIGRALLAELARRAMARECGRMEWSVLDWNVDAHRFYENLGARQMSDWTIWRLTAPAIRKLAT